MEAIAKISTLAKAGGISSGASLDGCAKHVVYTCLSTWGKALGKGHGNGASEHSD